jgi:aryl-alcohol dehydrogenase-like predicted oxidoreductase
MEMRTLGRQGLVVSAIGLGCMGMSEFYGLADEAESVTLVRRALDVGVTFLDTADMYGPFTNERLVGRAIRGHRDRTIVATKFGCERRPDGSWIRINGRPDYVRAACEASLQRLGIDYIDVYYQHRVDKSVPIEDTVGAMADLVREGKVRFLGLSEAAPPTIRRAHAVHPISALQTEYSLWTRDVEANGVLETVRELGIGFVAYSPLGRGFLTGRFQNQMDVPEGDYRRENPRFLPENLTRNLHSLRDVERMAQSRGVAPGQLALAWVLAQGSDIVPIPGTRQFPHLAQNVAASDIMLTACDLDRLAAAFPIGATAGHRYPDMSRVHR